MNAPHFTADWREVVFIHLIADPERLQQAVPFELDRHGGEAFVSLVAFTLSNMRVSVCPALSRCLMRPWSEHQFLNIRTYVREGNKTGIFFLAEFLNRAVAVPLGGLCYGLPYRLSRIEYEQADPQRLRGKVQCGALELSYTGRAAPTNAPDAFLLDRFHAFTEWRGWRRGFAVRHGPWQARQAKVELPTRSLLDQAGSWARSAEYAGAHYSRGVQNVAMSFPHTLGKY